MSQFDAETEWERWRGWLGVEPKQPTIFQDVVTMMATRQIWDEYREVYDHAPDRARSHGTFDNWLAGNYWRTQVMAVRRQVDQRRDVVSLRRLLLQIKKHPEVLNVERVARDRDADAAQAARDLASLVRVDGDHIEAAEVEEDLFQLKKDTHSVRRLATKSVAHYDEKLHEIVLEPVTWGELNAAIDTIVELFTKFRQLVLGAYMTNVVQMVPWTGIFEVAWFDPSGDPDPFGP